jgi:flagellar basal-body rod protein FlgB
MSGGIFNDPVMTVLEKVMDGCMLRGRVTANNIANVNTPGFKRSSVSFESELLGILSDGEVMGARSASDGLKDFQPAVQVDLQTASRYDGNNVNIDQEMAELSKNTIKFSLATELMKKKLGMLRYVITEGRR